MIAQHAMVLVSALALASCATPFTERPPLCRAMMDVARETVSSGNGGGVIAFVERNGDVSCEAEAWADAICAAYEASPPGAGLASLGAAVRSCLYGHGYVRRVERREVRGERMIASLRGGFRFSAVVVLRLDDEGRRYELDLQERIIVTEIGAAAPT